MDAQFPSIPEGLDHLRFLRQILILFVLYISLVHKGLEIGAVLDAIGRIDIYHLHLPGHTLLFQQRIHDHQAVSGNHPVGPVDAVLVKLDGLPAAAHPLCSGFCFKQAELSFYLPSLRIGVLLGHPGNDVQRLDGLMNVDRGGRDFKTHSLRLACPLECGVQVWIKLVGLEFLLRLIMLGHTHRRVVGTLLVIVRIVVNVAHFICVCQLFSRTCHARCPPIPLLCLS